MPRDVAKPGDARGFESDVGVEAAGDGTVDDGLLLLAQQRDQLPLGADEPVDLPVRMVQKPYDGGLFVGRRTRCLEACKHSSLDRFPKARVKRLHQLSFINEKVVMTKEARDDAPPRTEDIVSPSDHSIVVRQSDSSRGLINIEQAEDNVIRFDDFVGVELRWELSFRVFHVARNDAP